MLPEQSKNARHITETAIVLFRQLGYDNVSVRMICEKANVARSSFYSVFKDKSEILIYSLSSVKDNFQTIMPSFIMAENDLERIWLLTDSFLMRAVEAGPELCKVYFVLEISGKCDLFDILEGFNHWLVQLLVNCKKLGIVGVSGSPEELIPMQLNLAKALLFDWVRCGGEFPLRETVRHTIEVFLDVMPEYRHKTPLKD
jgi:AcrR family transcriptional regulator